MWDIDKPTMFLTLHYSLLICSHVACYKWDQVNSCSSQSPGQRQNPSNLRFCPCVLVRPNPSQTPSQILIEPGTMSTGQGKEFGLRRPTVISWYFTNPSINEKPNISLLFPGVSLAHCTGKSSTNKQHDHTFSPPKADSTCGRGFSQGSMPPLLNSFSSFLSQEKTSWH